MNSITFYWLLSSRQCYKDRIFEALSRLRTENEFSLLSSRQCYNYSMFLVGILGWWYGGGWTSRLQMIVNRLKATADFFSIGLMFKTLFAPFRQISAGRISGSVADQMRAFADRTVSRVVGAIARMCMIIAGVIVLSIQSLFGLIIMLFWPLIPLFPIVGLIAMVIGWVPTWQS